MSASAISTYTAAIKHLHTANGFDPSLLLCQQLPLIIRGVKRSQRRRRTRLPISYSTLRNILSHLLHHYPAPSHDRHMLAAATSLAFHGLLRVSEFTSPSSYSYLKSRTLQRRDISIQPDGTTKVSIRASKTDQQARGHQILIGCTGGTTCPALLIQQYLDHSHHHKFRPLFHFKSGCFLTRKIFANVLHECLLAVGANPKLYSTHSLRIGGATAAAAAGVHPTLIRDLGRWRSNCYQHYIRTPNAHLRAISGSMASST